MNLMRHSHTRITPIGSPRSVGSGVGSNVVVDRIVAGNELAEREELTLA
jgi:hypothetical protein